MADKPNLNQLMEMAQKMQKGMEEIQTAMAKKEISGKAGASPVEVEVVFNGQYDCQKVHISPEAIKAGQHVLQDLIKSAINSASAKVKTMSKDAMMDIYRKTGSPFGEDDTKE